VLVDDGDEHVPLPAVLGRRIEQVRDGSVVDVAAGRVDDITAMWKVRVARKAAWTNAEVLWTLRGSPHIRSAFFDNLDKSTGLAGRGLLTPTAIDTLT